MLRPDIIEKIKREREERDRPSAQIPLYVPELNRSTPQEDKKEDKDKSRSFVIEMA